MHGIALESLRLLRGEVLNRLDTLNCLSTVFHFFTHASHSILSMTLTLLYVLQLQAKIGCSGPQDKFNENFKGLKTQDMMTLFLLTEI